MKRSGKTTVYFSAPVETVWRIITAGNDVKVDPMSEEDYESREPQPGTVFTRAIDIVQNEKFEFEIKSLNCIERWTIRLDEAGVAETRMSVRNDVEYRKVWFYLLCFVGASPRRECKAFAASISERVHNRKR